MLRCDSLMSYFFKTSIEICIRESQNKLAAANIGRFVDGVPANIDKATVIAVKEECFYIIDALVGLIVLLIKYSGERVTVIKVSMLHKIMQLIVSSLTHEANEYTEKMMTCLAKDNSKSSLAYRSIYFNGLPYFRLLFMLFFNLNMPDHVFDSINLFLLMTFSHSLSKVSPKE